MFRLDEERAFEILTSIVTFPSVPQIIVQDLTNALIAQSAAAQQDDGAVLSRIRALLVHIQQRHPDLLQACFEVAILDAGENKNALEQLLISLSVELPGGAAGTSNAKDTDMVIASTSADAAVRVIAVRELLEKMSSSDIAESELVSRIHIIPQRRI